MAVGSSSTVLMEASSSSVVFSVVGVIFFPPSCVSFFGFLLFYGFTVFQSSLAFFLMSLLDAVYDSFFGSPSETIDEPASERGRLFPEFKRTLDIAGRGGN